MAKHATATVMDSDPGTLDELVDRTKELCAELFDAAGWKILTAGTESKGEQLATVFTYDIEPTGQLTIERSPGYAGDDDFVFVGIEGWDADASERIEKFLNSLAAAQKVAFGARVGSWV